MKVIISELEKVAVKKENYPSNNLPEFAFAGRSNVGKSSFINAMPVSYTHLTLPTTPYV